MAGPVCEHPHFPQGQKQDRGNGPNQLYLHDGKGAYTECAAERGVAEGTTLGFGSWFFDADNDGDLDILASNFTDEEYTRVLKVLRRRSRGTGTTLERPCM